MRSLRIWCLMNVFILMTMPMQAQSVSCDLNTAEEYRLEATDAYWDGDYDGAIGYLTCAIELDLNDASAYKFRGDVYSNFGDFDAAIADFDSAILIDPEFSGAYLNRAWAYLWRGDEIPHEDFFRWVLLEETVSIDADLFEAMGQGDLEIDEGYVYRFQFDGTAGQVFGAAALSADATDPLLILLDGNGVPLTSDDDGGVNLNSVIRRYTLPENSVYTLVLSQAGGYGQGDVELAIYVDGEIQSTNPDNPNVVDSFAVYNLVIDETAEVFTTGGDRLNIRSSPGTEYDVVAQASLGDRVTLLAGPVKEDGYSWWRIRTSDGIEGWAVERVVTEQTLQMAMIPGEEAIVSSGLDLLNVRDGTGRDFNVIFQLEDGAFVTLLDEEPILRDNLRWWHIRDAEGREGWAVDRIGVERVLVPAREFPTISNPSEG